MNFLLLKKLQGFINILQAVNTHAAFGGPWLLEAEEKGPMLGLLCKGDHNKHEAGNTIGYLNREKKNKWKHKEK